MKGWKTLAVSAAIALLGAAQTFDWATIIPQDKFWSGLAMTGIGALFAWLRTVTSTPVGQK